MSSPFQSAAFRVLWCSRLVSAAGFWMDQVTTGWLALEVGGGPAAVGTVMSLRLLPLLVLGMVSGAAADRFPRRLILMAVGATGATVALLLAWLTASGEVALWQIGGLALVSGCMMVFDMPARSALAVDLVGRASLARAVALNALAFYFFGALGAFSGGALIERFGVSQAYLGVAAFHLVGLVLIASLRHRERPAERGPVRIAYGPTLRDGARLIRGNAAVRLVVGTSLCVELFGYSYQTAVPPLARDVLGVGAEGLGALAASASIGATITVLLLTLLPATAPRQPLMAGVMALWGASQIGLGLAPTFATALVAMALAGGCAAAVDALQQTLVQLAVPEEQRGRAMGVWVASIGTNSLGYYQVGLVATAIGAALALVVNGALMAGCSGLTQALAPTYRLRRRGAAAPALVPADG